MLHNGSPNGALTTQLKNKHLMGGKHIKAYKLYKAKPGK